MTDSQNQPFQIDVEAPDPCQRIIKVAVPSSHYARQYQRCLAAAVRNHERPGFRKGKTPRNIVEKELGDRLRAEAFEGLVPQAYHAAVIEHGLWPITDPVLKNVVFKEGDDVSFDLVIEVKPEVTAVEYEGLPIKEKSVEVSTEDVDEYIERLRESRAVFETVPRPAAEGDQVVVDLVPRLDDGALDEEHRAGDQQLIVGDEQNLPVFNEVLVGAEAGLERDVTVDYPEDYPNPDLRSKTMIFALHVSSVQRKVLPEVDDAFASQLYEGQTLLELRGRIREALAEEARRRAAEEMDAQILDRLLERNEVPIPSSLVNTWLDKAVQDMHRRNDQVGRPNTDDMDQAYRQAFRPVAEREIKGMFLRESVRKQESIVVSEQDVENRVAAIAAQNGFDLQKYRAFLTQNEERKRIERDILERKTYDFLLSRAEITAAAEDSSDAQAGEERG
jgi:trigger factor